MPVLKTIDYNPPIFLKFNHFHTIYPAIMRKVNEVTYTRQRLETPDGDFLDLDWSTIHSRKLAVVLHGLEGSADRPYIRGMIRAFNQNNWDGVGLNFRGCSGETNRLIRGYHSGETEDLDFVLNTIFDQNKYDEIVLVGFSLGGNVVMKYTGERGTNLHPAIKKAIGISVPCDLAGCSASISEWRNYLYLNRFLASLKEKVKLKEELAKASGVDINAVFNSKDFADFDGHFTAPVHGFESAEDYWAKSSSLNFLENISIPSLIINSKDDSFLSKTCYPYELAEENANLHLLVPDHGGHVGFVQFSRTGLYWTEERVMEFVSL